MDAMKKKTNTKYMPYMSIAVLDGITYRYRNQEMQKKILKIKKIEEFKNKNICTKVTKKIHTT